MKNKTKKIILTPSQIREFAIKLAEFEGRPHYPTILVKDAVEANRHDESHFLLDQILEYAYNLNKASAEAEAKRINEEERIAQLQLYSKNSTTTPEYLETIRNRRNMRLYIMARSRGFNSFLGFCRIHGQTEYEEGRSPITYRCKACNTFT